MDIPETLIPWLVALFFYIEAGRRTWQVLFLSLPDRSNEPLAHLVRGNSVPWWVMTIWYVFWFMIVCAGFVLRRWRSLNAGKPSSLDLK